MVTEDLNSRGVDDKEQEDFSPRSSPSKPAGFRTLTRLIIGGVLLGIDELNANLGKWGTEIPQSRSNFADPISSKPDGTYFADFSASEPIPSDENTQTGNFIRYALIGLAFSVQDRINYGLKAIDQATRAIHNTTNPLVGPISKSKVIKPFRLRYDDLVMRGQQEINRWVYTGQAEDSRSRHLAQTALEKSVDRSIDYLTTSEEIKELIETQSVSLAGEVIEEIRERAVSADNLLEGVVRKVLGRAPRSVLPPPPTEIMDQARPFVRRAGRVVRKT